MRPIQNIEMLRPGSVLYHSAFGFARVTRVESQQVQLTWEASPDNLPTTVAQDILKRVYAQCLAGGFFYRTLNEHETMTVAVQRHPLDTLASLLKDLPEPQPGPAIIDWLVRRRLLGLDSAQRWWKSILSRLPDDARFQWTGDCIHLAETCLWEEAKHSMQLDDMSAQRRLELATQYRRELGEDAYQKHVCHAWVEGGGPLDERALTAFVTVDPTDVIERLMSHPGSDHALAHYLQHGPSEVDHVPDELHARLRARIGLSASDPLDEGRLTFALVCWRCPGAAALMVERATRPRTQAQIRRACQALPYEMAEAFLIEMIHNAMQGAYPPVTQWLAREYLRLTLQDGEQASANLLNSRPDIASWFDECFEGHEDLSLCHGPHEPTEEIVAVPSPTRGWLEGERRPLVNSGLNGSDILLRCGHAIVKSLADDPAPSTPSMLSPESVWVHVDGTLDIEPGEERSDASSCDRPSLTPVTRLLLHALMGRPLPLDPSPWKVLAGLHAVRDDLPPSGWAPLAAGLHPDPGMRPAIEVWREQLEAALQAEEHRDHPDTPGSDRVLEVGFDSHIGRSKLLYTQVNEDALYVASSDLTALIVLCDGISTCNAGRGDLASNLVCEMFANAWEQDQAHVLAQPTARVLPWIEQVTRQANDIVCHHALQHAGGDLKGRIPMGTTMVVLIVHEGTAYLASAGDSRAYLVGPYGASLLTADDNQSTERMQRWVKEGWPRWRAQGPALTRYLGYFDAFDRPITPPLRCRQFPLAPSEQVLLCTDGITHYLSDNEPEVARQLASVLHQATNPQEAASALIELANHAGGKDNASCVVLRAAPPQTP